MADEFLQNAETEEIVEESMTYTINIGDFTAGDIVYPNRALSASFGGNGIQVGYIPWENTEYNPWDFVAETDEIVESVEDEEGNVIEVPKTIYNGQFTLAPIEMPTVEEVPTQLDRIEAQVTYTAMMTDTILMEEGDA